MKNKNLSRYVFLIILIGIGVRILGMNETLNNFPSREAFTAMIARNFYYHGFDIFYPQVDHTGEENGYIVLEFGLVPLIISFLYKISGGIFEIWGSVVSIIFWLGAVIILFNLVKSYWDPETAFWAAVSFTFSPIAIICSKAFQPDMAMLFFSIAAVSLFYKWSLNDRFILLIGSTFCTAMAVLLKITAFHIIFPIFFLAYLKYQRKVFLKKEIWFFILGCALPILLWNYHGFRVSRIYPSSAFGHLWNPASWVEFSRALNPKTYLNFFTFWAGVVLTPIGVALFIFGIILRVEEKKQFLAHFWLAGVIIYMVLFCSHTSTHNYYHLPLLPVASIFIGRAIKLVSGILPNNLYKNKITLAAGISLIGYSVFFYIDNSDYQRIVTPAHRVKLVKNRPYKYVEEAAHAVKMVTNRNDLIIASCGSGPKFIYYCDRKGWDFYANYPGRDMIEHLELLRKEGASYFASASFEELERNKELSEYLYKTYNVVVEEKDKYVIFDIRHKPGKG